MNFSLKLNLDNAAFRDPDTDKIDPTDLARILREVADKVEGHQSSGFCMDYNGNRVGSWGYVR